LPSRLPFYWYGQARADPGRQGRFGYWAVWQNGLPDSRKTFGFVFNSTWTQGRWLVAVFIIWVFANANWYFARKNSPLGGPFARQTGQKSVARPIGKPLIKPQAATTGQAGDGRASTRRSSISPNMGYLCRRRHQSRTG